MLAISIPNIISNLKETAIKCLPLKWQTVLPTTEIELNPCMSYMKQICHVQHVGTKTRDLS
jgi:hypothetical protein